MDEKERRRPLAEFNLLAQVNLLDEPGMQRNRRGCRFLPLGIISFFTLGAVRRKMRRGSHR
jgi:hypothetical protein